MRWQVASPDLTGCDEHLKQPVPKAAATVANTKKGCYGVIYSIAPSAIKPGLIWAGSDTGLIHVTQDEGKTWSDVTPPGLSDWSKIAQVDASHFDAGTVYAAVDRHRLDDRTPYIYRSHDFGKTWSKITNGIAENAYVQVVREDPARKGMLFAGT